MNFSRNVVSARIRTVNPGIGAWTHKREEKREKRERTPLLYLSPHRKKNKQKKRIFYCAPWNCNDKCETIPYSIIYEHKLKGLKAYPRVYTIQVLWLFANSCRLVNVVGNREVVIWVMKCNKKYLSRCKTHQVVFLIVYFPFSLFCRAWIYLTGCP